MTYFFLALVVISVVALSVLSLKGESVGFEDSAPDYFTLSKCNAGNHRARLLVPLCVKTLDKSLSAIKKRDKLFEYEKWLYDNAYKVRGWLTSIKRFNVNRLPSYRAMPRLYFILKRCVNENDGKIDKWTDYVEKFNNYGYLLYRETVSLRTVAAYALCEYLTVYYSKSYVAYTYFLKGKKDGAERKINIHCIKYASYLSGLLQNSDLPLEKKLKQLCEDNGIDMYGKIAEYRAERDEYCVKVKNAITSISGLYALVSDGKLLKTNKVNNFLDKSEVFYKDNDEQTKFEYLRLIANRATKNSEMKTAVKYVEKCKKTGSDLYAELVGKPFSSSTYALLFLLRLSLAVAVCVFVGMNFSRYFAIVFFPVAYAFIKHVFRFLVQKPQRFTPKTKTSEGKTLIVISALVLNPDDAVYAVKRAETVKRANPDFDVCLLADFKDGQEKTDPHDRELISKLENLNEGVYCIVRERKFTSKGYVAWEKKRGAILELFEHILYKRSDFAYCSLPNKNYAYAITLDIDSDIILAERAERAISHPYFSSSAVLSFSSFPALKEQSTAYARLFTDSAGGYSHSGFTLENDVFGKGNYTGKGICRIKEFYERAFDVFPDNRILSHDFIEGAFVGCKNCDVAVSEDTPQTFGQNTARESRWIRGDWQLLPYVFPTVKDRNGNKRKNNIGLVNKAHILANMFSSLYPVFLLASLLLSRGYTVLFALAVPLFAIAVSVFDVINSPKKALKNIARQFYALATLPAAAATAIYSVFITLVRLARGKNLLQWKTFRHASSANYCSVFSILFGALFVALSFFNSDAGLFAIGIIFASGALSFLLDAKILQKPVNTEVKKIALDLINATGAYFLSSLAASPLYLVPDFYSEESHAYAKMTSPTNIGFSLISLKCLLKTGFINEREFKDKTDRIINSVASLKKYRGHLYNWYDVNSGEPLPPRYVSTVDSGNFCMALCFVKDELSKESAATVNCIITDTDFSFLINADKKLLATGFCNDTKKLDESCYDLYASESLLTYVFCLGYNKIDRRCAFSLDGSGTYYKGNTLYSWTGGAFEYLMTSLFIPYVKGSALYRSACSHVRAQKRYPLPFWGVSECQYNAYDDGGNRKYKAFGIDKTAYKNAFGTARAPYACALCVEFSPIECVRNLKKAEEWGMRGRYGMYESYDGAVIKTYMAHHQGMILLALYNSLTNGVDKTEFSSSPEISSALLYLLRPQSDKRFSVKREPRMELKDVVTVKSETLFDTNVLTCGAYAAAYFDNGESEAFYDGKCAYLTGGNDIVLTSQGRSYSLTSGARSALDEGRCKYVIDNSLFRASVTVTASSAFEGEVRQIEITNKTDMPQNYTLAFYVEPALVRKEEFIAHKTYSKMFLKTSVTNNALIACRKGIAIALTTEKNAVKECDRGRIFRKSRSVTNVDPCLFTAVDFSLQSEKSEVFYNALICAKSELLAQNLAYVYEKTDKSTLMETSVRQTASASVGENIKNTLSALRRGKNVSKTAFGAPAVIIDCAENKLYKLKELANALIKVSYFAPRFTACVLYAEHDGYFKSVGNKAKEEVARAKRDNGAGNVVFEFLEKSVDKEKIDELTAVATRPTERFRAYPKKPLLIKKAEEEAKVPLPEIVLETDCGGFYKDGFLITKTPPKTWSNVVSNGNVGFIATESGDGYTFYSSSRQEKITDFSFDPFKTSLSEGVVFCEDNLVWSASPSPSGNKCYCLHESGKTIYKTGFNGIAITQKTGVGGTNKFIVINLRNTSGKPRKIYITFFARLVLGDFVENTENFVTYARKANVLTAKNSQNGLEVSLSCNADIIDYSFDTRSCQAKNGEIAIVKDFPESERRDGFVYTVSVSLEREKQVVFSLGKNASPDFSKAEDIIEEFSAASKSMSNVTVKSGDKDVDCLFPWLIPQTYFSRFKARCGFYQIGGAYGFRDQLQDCLALLYAAPDEVREHILYCAARQFESGDVLHWWHHPYTGVRTRISDDRLFLPYVTAKYIAFTGDKNILSEQVPFLKDERYDKVLYKTFTPTEYKTSLKDHLVRAIHSCKFATNGLVLMGDGDWNDAMNNAGSRGLGSSVWLSMFLYAVISDCSEFLDNSEFYSRVLARLKDSVNAAFDGKSFARLVTDDGVKLGYNDGFVDIITQSWATLSSIADTKTCLTALSTAEKLVDDNKRIIKLLAPPFSEETTIGSIGQYPKGVRENGGQYTHGAVWYVMALYKSGQTEKAYEYLKYLVPSTHCKNGESAVYKNEPYVVSADVYESGEGGWSWYTGSSAWMFVLIVEYLFGVNKRADTVTLSPALPSAVNKAELTLRFSDIEMKIDIDNTGEGEWKLFYGEIMHENNALMINVKNHGKNFKLKKTR